MPVNGNTGTFITLLTTFVSAILDFLVAFHLFAFSDIQRTAVMGVLTGGVILGLFIYSILHTWKVVNLASLIADPARKAKQLGL